MDIWGFVPARGGSKSIPLKNLVDVGGRPMLDYCVLAAMTSGRLSRVIVSTDSNRIAQRARLLGVDVDNRPTELSGDEVLVDNVVKEFLERTSTTSPLPDALALIQPTSPFILPKHFVQLFDALEARPDALSAHNVVAVPPIAHAWNQRWINEKGEIEYLFPEQRKLVRQKQDKPALKILGNLLVTRCKAYLSGKGVYAEPSVGVEIDRPYDFDLDGPDDLIVARALISAGAVDLSHLVQAT